MITSKYNPSIIEVELAKVLKNLHAEISSNMENNTIESVDLNLDKDNPDVILNLKDTDGDKHTVVLKIIQRPDTFQREKFGDRSLELEERREKLEVRGLQLNRLELEDCREKREVSNQ